MKNGSDLELVTSLVEVWIEIIYPCISIYLCIVTSLVEVWIEMSGIEYELDYRGVTSLVEVWIEIHKKQIPFFVLRSLPLRKCGLK